MINEKTKLITRKTIGILAGVFFILIVLPTAAYLVYENYYKERIYYGVRIGAHDFGGLSQKQAKDKLDEAVEKIKHEGITFHYHNQSSYLYPLIASLEGDIAIEVMAFDAEASARRLYEHGRHGTFLNRLAVKIRSLFDPYYYGLLFAVNENELEKFFFENFARFTNPAQNARLVYAPENLSDKPKFSIQEESYGQTLDTAKAANELKRKLGNLDLSLITLSAAIDYPVIYKKDLLNIEAKAEEIAALAPVNLKYSAKSWPISRDVLARWLLIKDASGAKSEYRVGLDHGQVIEHLKENIAQTINIEPIEAKFEMKDGKVTEFQPSRDGLELVLEESAARLETELLANKSKDMALVVREKKSAITTDNINDLGIKELLGTGHSSFAGSPSNRRHNIAIGAKAVNGTLLAPDEEFSLLAVLGKIDKEAGYLPELVIKDNKTVPEYGGGLCQIGTTAFRGTVAAGLPVTMRRNHSYRVSYYEPAGTDATIYNPWPDYRFKNDYQSHLLITSRIEGSDIYFDFWGTDDGRIATATYPVIYNIRRPAPTLIIETPDLAPGQKRCTEKAHNGADAYFDYTVKYPEDNPPEALREKDDFSPEELIVEMRFKSHYVPWREVCMVGIDPNKTDDAADGQPDE